MANKGLSKKKGKKKITFTRKDWYDVKVATRQVGKTNLVNKTQGKIASGFKPRVFEVSLHNDPDAERSFRLIDVQGRYYNVLTNFHGMDTTDKLMVKKWKTLEASADSDGYLLRVPIGFTLKEQLSQRKYAQHTQVRGIRKKMEDITRADIQKSDIKGVVLPDSIAKLIKACPGIPLHVYIRKVKVLKDPRFELSTLPELHGDGDKGGSGDSTAGAKVDRLEPPVQENV
uniref:40s ribosomal protein S3a n=1 Tax=Galeruca daurica TaxID=1651263 RepID=A0A7G7HCE6_9CUCU|nr:40s ribosomal protein S3a [Galeruca daurica]